MTPEELDQEWAVTVEYMRADPEHWMERRWRLSSLGDPSPGFKTAFERLAGEYADNRHPVVRQMIAARIDRLVQRERLRLARLIKRLEAAERAVVTPDGDTIEGLVRDRLRDMGLIKDQVLDLAERPEPEVDHRHTLKKRLRLAYLRGGGQPGHLRDCRALSPIALRSCDMRRSRWFRNRCGGPASLRHHWSPKRRTGSDAHDRDPGPDRRDR